MEKDAFARPLAHPNLALLDGLTQRPVCCLVTENASDEQLRGLGLQIVHVYRQRVLCAALFELPQESDWQAALEARLGALALSAGVSGPFVLAASAQGCMHKARIALETGRRAAPSRALYAMSEYSETALIAAAAKALAAEGFAPGDFCDAAVSQMTALDARTGTQYAPSLREYLRHGLNLRQAAQALNIHRNTLDYRMKRVQELFALDLENVNTCFELLFSFWLTDHFPADESGARTDASQPFDACEAQTTLWRCIEGGTPADGASDAQFDCRLLGVNVGSLPDEKRIALLKALCALLPQASACAFDEDVLLFALPPHEMDAFASACRAECGKSDCPTILTQPFRSGRLPQHAKLCRMALYVAPQRHVRIQDIGSTLFFMALERRISLSPYLCEEVIRVMDDDALRGTSLSRSLYVYLLNFMDMKRAAAQLGIHRNTMEYQMRKIDALIGAPALQEQRFLMMCTYKMLALPNVPRFGL